MAIYVNDRFFNNRPLPLEAKYLNSGGTYYADVAEVNTTIISEYRHIGLTVLLPDGEYWYKDGTADNDLVKKESDISTTGLSGATNGLYKDGQTVKLGGGLIENTVISGLSTNDLTFSDGDVKYGGNYRSTFDEYSLVDAGYVTGITDGLLTCNDFDGYTGDTDSRLTTIETDVSTNTTNIGSNTTNIATNATNISGNTNDISDLESNKQDCISGNACEIIVHNGSDPTAQSSFVFDYTNNSLVSDAGNNTFDSLRSTILSATNVDASGAANSAIIGVTGINATGTTYNNTLSVGDLALWNIGGTGDLVVRDSTSKKLCLTSLGTIGGISGATNGLGTIGQDVCLGGDLDSDTTIDGISSYTMTYDNMCGFNVVTINSGDVILDGQNSGGVYIRSQSGNTATGWNDSVGIAVDYNNGFKIYDNRVTKIGIEYDGKYHDEYTDRSLVDKEYVNNLVTGLQPKAAVWVATTGDTTLSGLQVIDGVQLVADDRVLVKNQTDKSENGIYVAASGAWSRSDDFDFTPEGEVAQGDLIPVISGDTLADTSWILITEDPISASTEKVFSLFSRLLDLQEGSGIDIATVGGKKTISVELLATNSGLVVDGSGLRVDSNIAGKGLTWDNAVINVNAVSGGSSSTDVSVKLDENDNLVVNPDDINACFGDVITKANNGLCKVGDTVILGGSLTGDTNIDGGNTNNLTLTNLNSFNVSFDNTSVITDSRTTKLGLEYNETGYTFSDCSLITKYYVDSCVDSATNGAIYNACNGLTEVGDTVVLGGANALTGNTLIKSDDHGLGFGNDSTHVTSKGSSSFVFGNSSNSGIIKSNGVGSLAFGTSESGGEINSTSNGSLAFGWSSVLGKIEAIGSGSFAGGETTGGGCVESTSIASFAFGLNAQALDAQAVAFGLCTVSSGTTAKFVLGEFNEIKSDAILEVGIGGDDTSRCNALEVYTTGDVAIPNLPTGTTTQITYIDNTTGKLSVGSVPVGDVNDACNGLTKVGETIILGGANALTGDTVIKSGGHGLAFGCVDTNPNIAVLSTGDTSFAFGFVSHYNYGDQSKIESSGKGSFAFGHSYGYGNNTYIKSTGCGSFAGGYSYAGGAQDSCTVSSGCGSFAMGYNYSGYIGSTGKGSVAMGEAHLYGEIKSTCWGSIAMGNANEGCIISAGNGSFAGGYANNWEDLISSGNSSFAFGKNVCALEDQSVAFGLCTISSGNTAKFVIGKYNTIKSNTIMEVGVGSNVSNKSNAFEIYTNGNIAIPQTPTTGSTTDDVLVWNNTDKYIKRVPQNTLGEDNNKYTITNISSNYTILNTDFVIVVDTSSNTVTVTLPSSPTSGQAYKIKDAGNGYTNNITISGNGNNIDNGTTAIINTDYGALELVYDGTQWYSLAFIN